MIPLILNEDVEFYSSHFEAWKIIFMDKMFKYVILIIRYEFKL